MLKGRMYVWLIVGLMFGMVLAMPLKGANDVIVGMNHWSRNTSSGFLYPSNTSDDVNLSGNELLDANLSRYAGDYVSWDSVDLEFDVTGGGSSKWNRAGTTLFTKVNGDSVQFNSSVLFDDGDVSFYANNDNNMRLRLSAANRTDVDFSEVLNVAALSPVPYLRGYAKVGINQLETGLGVAAGFFVLCNEGIDGGFSFYNYSGNIKTGGKSEVAGVTLLNSAVLGERDMNWWNNYGDINFTVGDVCIVENLTVSENITAAQFNVVNAPYTWNMYVDVNGTLVWEME